MKDSRVALRLIALLIGYVISVWLCYRGFHALGVVYRANFEPGHLPTAGWGVPLLHGVTLLVVSGVSLLGILCSAVRRQWLTKVRALRFAIVVVVFSFPVEVFFTTWQPPFMVGWSIWYTFVALVESVLIAFAVATAWLPYFRPRNIV
jgi:hypothetical protein